MTVCESALLGSKQRVFTIFAGRNQLGGPFNSNTSVLNNTEFQIYLGPFQRHKYDGFKRRRSEGAGSVLGLFSVSWW